MESAIKSEGRMSRLEGRVDEALTHVASKADIAELRGMMRIIIALNLGMVLALLSMVLGWLPVGG
ncbi:MAG: hypothetical protein OXE46_01115 [Chloroflexi bacterium]|nr:hypothetical protein [Chloroflexota bacterium]